MKLTKYKLKEILDVTRGASPDFVTQKYLFYN